MARNCVFLFLNLEEDHSAFDVRKCDEDEMLERLQYSLRIPVPPNRTKRDEAQITLLIRALLQISGGSLENEQYGFTEEYTVRENAEFCASVFQVTRLRQFGDFDPIKLCKTLSESLVFSGATINTQYLEEWTTMIMDSLRIGFRKGYLVGYSQGRTGSMLI